MGCHCLSAYFQSPSCHLRNSKVTPRRKNPEKTPSAVILWSYYNTLWKLVIKGKGLSGFPAFFSRNYVSGLTTGSHWCRKCYAKSLQSCPTLCDPIDGSPPGSPIPGILQARTLEWAAISFSNAWKWKVKVKPPVKEACGLYSRRVEQNRKGAWPSLHGMWGSGRLSRGAALLSCKVEGECLVTCWRITVPNCSVQGLGCHH